jgi:peptidyl-tRNA hydrolase
MDAVDRLLDTYSDIDPDVRTAALNGGWYRESRRTARKLARKHGVTLATAAGVIAALSPRIRWATNVEAADKVLAGAPNEEVAGYNRNVEKARRIAQGERPLQVLGGPKVTAFYRAMMGDDEAAVVDVWMWQAMGFVPAQVPYATAEEALRQAAKQAGLPVATFQALVWTQVRGGGD